MTGISVPGPRRARLQLPGWVVVAAALAGAVLAGAAMTRDVRFGVGIALALCFVPLVLMNVQLAIVLWVPTVSLIAVDALNAGLLAGMMILVAWFGLLAARRSRVAAAVVEQARTLIGVAALILWMLLSIAWAEEPPIGSDLFFAWLIAGLIMLVIPTVLTDRLYLRLAVAAFVVGAVASVALGLLGGAVETAEGRVVGGIGDANVLAAGIMPAILLAVALAVGARRVIVGATALIAVVVLAMGLVATASRGGFVAALVGAVAVLVLAKRHRAWAVAFLLCTIGAIAAWFSVDAEAWQRVSDLREGSGTGRVELWNVAWQMWQNNPLVGVGLEAFRDNASAYVRAIGPLEYSAFLTEQPKVVHNTYLELLAETGVVGLLLYVGVLTASLRCAWRAATIFERAGDLAMMALSRGTIAALVSMAAAIAFISGAADRRLWVLIALGPALLACARRTAGSGLASTKPSAAPPPGLVTRTPVGAPTARAPS